MSDDLHPDDYPFGQTKYLNYDPEQVNTPKDAVGVLEWIADDNADKGNVREAEVFNDAASMVRTCLVEDETE